MTMHLILSKGAFLAKEWNSLHITTKKIAGLKDFPTMDVNRS
jgi:hypothetical protein